MGLTVATKQKQRSLMCKKYFAESKISNSDFSLKYIQISAHIIYKLKGVVKFPCKYQEFILIINLVLMLTCMRNCVRTSKTPD